MLNRTEETIGRLSMRSRNQRLLPTILIFLCIFSALFHPLEMVLGRGTDLIQVGMGEDDCFVKMQLRYGLSSSQEALEDMEALRDVQHKFPRDLKSKLGKVMEKAMRDAYSPRPGHDLWELEVDGIYLDMSMSGEEARIELSFHVEGVVYTEDSNVIFNLSWRDFRIKENILCQNVVVDPDLFAFAFDEHFGADLDEWDKSVQDANTILQRTVEIELYPDTTVSTSFTVVIPHVEGVTVEPDIVHVKGPTVALDPLTQVNNLIQQYWIALAVALILLSAAIVYFVAGRERIEDLVDRVS